MKSDPNLIAYRRYLNEWRETMLGEFVAIVDGQLVDHDFDRQTLVKRVLEAFIGAYIFIGKVQAEDDEVASLSGGALEVTGL